MASSRPLRPPLSEDHFARQAIEILLCAPDPQASACLAVRRLAIVGPAPDASDFSAGLQFTRLSAHFKDRLLASLERVARAAVQGLCDQSFNPPPGAVLSGGSGAVLVSFGAPRMDFHAENERETTWRTRWDRAQSMIEQEALPEWICLHFLAEGARLVAARDERGDQVGLAAQPSDFLANSAQAQFAVRERAKIAQEFGFSPASPPRASDPRRL